MKRPEGQNRVELHDSVPSQGPTSKVATQYFVTSQLITQPILNYYNHIADLVTVETPRIFATANEKLLLTYFTTLLIENSISGDTLRESDNGI